MQVRKEEERKRKLGAHTVSAKPGCIIYRLRLTTMGQKSVFGVSVTSVHNGGCNIWLIDGLWNRFPIVCSTPVSTGPSSSPIRPFFLSFSLEENEKMSDLILTWPRSPFALFTRHTWSRCSALFRKLWIETIWRSNPTDLVSPILKNELRDNHILYNSRVIFPL